MSRFGRRATARKRCPMPAQMAPTSIVRSTASYTQTLSTHSWQRTCMQRTISTPCRTSKAACRSKKWRAAGATRSALGRSNPLASKIREQLANPLRSCSCARKIAARECGTSWIPNATPDSRPTARIPPHSRTRERRVPAIRFDSPQFVSQHAGGAVIASRVARRAARALRGSDHGRRRLYRKHGHRPHRWSQHGPLDGRHGTGAPPAHHDDRRSVSVSARGAAGTLSADERQLRTARRTGRTHPRQAPQARTTRGACDRSNRDLAHRDECARICPMSEAPPELALPNEIADFLEHLEKERNDSPNTVTAYRRDLHALVAFLASYYGTQAWTWEGVDRLA